MLQTNMLQTDSPRAPLSGVALNGQVEGGGIGDLVNFAVAFLRRQYLVIIVTAALAIVGGSNDETDSPDVPLRVLCARYDRTRPGVPDTGRVSGCLRPGESTIFGKCLRPEQLVSLRVLRCSSSSRHVAQAQGFGAQGPM